MFSFFFQHMFIILFYAPAWLFVRKMQSIITDMSILTLCDMSLGNPAKCHQQFFYPNSRCSESNVPNPMFRHLVMHIHFPWTVCDSLGNPAKCHEHFFGPNSRCSESNVSACCNACNAYTSLGRCGYSED